MAFPSPSNDFCGFTLTSALALIISHLKKYVHNDIVKITVALFVVKSHPTGGGGVDDILN